MVTVKIRKKIKITIKIRSGGSCPIITEIDGGTPEGIFEPINGILDGGTP